MLFYRSSFDFLFMKLGKHQAYHFRTVPDEPGVIRLTILPWPRRDTSAERQAFVDCNHLIAAMRQFIKDLMPQLVTEAGATCPKCDSLHIKIERVAMYGYIYCPVHRCHVDMTRYWRLLSIGEPYMACSNCFMKCTLQEKRLKISHSGVQSVLKRFQHLLH